MITSLATLQSASLATLEQRYRSAPCIEWEPGLYRGHVLRRLDNRGTARIANRLMMVAGFEHTPFWVDRTRNLWAFGHPRLAAGRFVAQRQPSRWRATETWGLHYQRSRLPSLLRNRLYDEVKPLSPTLCLGIGGLNAEKDDGDLFFFALERED